MNIKDILLDSDFDLMAVDGDFVVGDSTIQNQALLLASGPGEFKETPTCGIGLEGYLLDENPAVLLREIRRQFTIDGMKVSKVAITATGELDIKAEY